MVLTVRFLIPDAYYALFLFPFSPTLLSYARRQEDLCISERKPYVAHMSQGFDVQPPAWLAELAEWNFSVAIWGSYGQSPNKAEKSKVIVIQVQGTTWTTGRNALYKTALELEMDFCYFVFYDGDARLEYLPAKHFRANYHVRILPAIHDSPLQYWERILREDRPAMATVHKNSDHARKYRAGYLENCEIWETKNSTKRGQLHVDVCTVNQDAIITAFHHDAAKVLLPYESILDNRSWWLSQLVMIELAFRTFPHACMEYGMLKVTNPEHGIYPNGFSLSHGAAMSATRALLDQRVGKTCAQYLWRKHGSSSFRIRNGWSFEKLCSFKRSIVTAPYTSHGFCGP